MGTLDFTEPNADTLDFTRPPLDATRVKYTPAMPGNWSPLPTTVQEALDQLAAVGGGGGGTTLYDESFVATPGQTDFVLARPPGPIIFFMVNAAIPSAFIVIPPQTVRWIGGYSLKTGDTVRIVYN